MMMPSANNNGSGNNKHSLLDRSIPIVLPTAADADLDQQTPSRKQGVSVQLERLHRLQGTSLISMGIHILQQQQQPSTSAASAQEPTTEPTTAITAPAISYSPTSWYASASTIFHRYYHGVSLIERDVWSVAMASTLIAAKLEEIPLTVRQLIIVYAHLYTRRRNVVIKTTSHSSMTTRGDTDDNHNNVTCLLIQKIINHPEVLVAPDISEQSSSSRRETITPLTPASVQALSPTGPLWKEWHEALLQTESSILRQLGFVLHWIPNRHVHKFMYAFLHVLQITSPPAKTAAATTTTTSRTASNPSADDAADNDDDDDRRRRCLTQGAWNYCNLSYRLDLCVRYEAAVIACAAIYLAALDLDLDQDLHVVKSLRLASNSNNMNTHPWWTVLLLGTTADITDNAQVAKTATDLVQIANALAGLAPVSSSASVSADARSKGGHADDNGNSSSGSINQNNGDEQLDQNQLDVLVASVAFLKPLNPDSFHGPESFVWEMANRHDAATAAGTSLG
jgi:Cyclin, N-terminal domain